MMEGKMISDLGMEVFVLKFSHYFAPNHFAVVPA